MKLIAICITKNATMNGGVQSLRQVVLLVCIPTQTDNYDGNSVYLGLSYGGTKYTYGYDNTGFVTSIGYGGTAENATVTPLLQYSYYPNVVDTSGAIRSNKVERKTYANGNVEDYTYSISGGHKTQVNYKNTENSSTIGSYI